MKIDELWNKMSGHLPELKAALKRYRDLLNEELRLDGVLREVPAQIEALADQDLTDVAAQRKFADLRMQLDMANLRKRKAVKERANLEKELGEGLYAAWDVYRSMLGALWKEKEAAIAAALAPFCGDAGKVPKELNVHACPCFAPIRYGMNFVTFRPSLKDGRLDDHIAGFLAHTAQHVKALGLS